MCLLKKVLSGRFDKSIVPAKRILQLHSERITGKLKADDGCATLTVMDSMSVPQRHNASKE
jgi:hypothetical protein